jgi:hypothetical protein
MSSETTSPKYQHDCKACKFLGHYVGYDVYICPSNPSIIGRFADDPSEYHSMILTDFQDLIRENKPIGFANEKPVPFQTFVMSGKCRYFQAWIFALASPICLDKRRS